MINRHTVKKRIGKLIANHPDSRKYPNFDEMIQTLQKGEAIDWEKYRVTPILRSIIEQLADQGGELE